MRKRLGPFSFLAIWYPSTFNSTKEGRQKYFPLKLHRNVMPSVDLHPR